MKSNLLFLLPIFFLQSPSNQLEYLSKPKTIHIATEEEVDFTQSKILWNGEALDCTEGIVFRVEKEGKNILEYVLENEAGEILEKGKKIYILDTKEPEIEVSVEGTLCEQSIGLMDKQDVHVSFKEENLAIREIYVDDELLDSTAESISLSSKNKNLKVVATDFADHRVEKEYVIEAVEDIEIQSSQNQTYSLEEELSLESESSLEDYECLVNGKIQDSFSVFFDQSQEYDIQVRHKIYPYLIPFQQTIIFSKEPLEFQLNPSKLKSNQDIHVFASIQSDYISQAILKDSLGNVYSFEKDILFAAKENTNQVIELQGYVKDLFGREITKSITLQINTIQPTISVIVNNQRMNEEEFTFHDVKQVDIEASASMKESFLLDGYPKNYVSLEQALKNMKGGERLQYEVIVEDEFGNTIQTLYSFKKQYIPPIIAYQSVNTTRDVKEERVWSVDEKGKINLVETKEEKIWHPLIYLDSNCLVAGKEIDIVLMNIEKVKELVVNGKQMDISLLEKDELGNWKYTIHLDRKATTLSVYVKDQENQWTKKEVSVQSAPNQAWIYLIAPICLAVILFCLKKYV